MSTPPPWLLISLVLVLNGMTLKGQINLRENFVAPLWKILRYAPHREYNLQKPPCSAEEYGTGLDCIDWLPWYTRTVFRAHPPPHNTVPGLVRCKIVPAKYMVSLSPLLSFHNQNHSDHQSASIIPISNPEYGIRICNLIDLGHDWRTMEQSWKFYPDFPPPPNFFYFGVPKINYLFRVEIELNCF